ncbi:MAG: methyltransferase domain-containing protein [Acidimicrobiales bacterium]
MSDETPTDTYTHGHHASVLRAHTWRTIANSAPYLDPLLEPGRRLLDVGCGPGSMTAEFADRVAPAEVVGVDVVADVIEKARSAHERGNLRFEVADAYTLPFDDSSFDIVHAHQVLQHVSDPVALLRECSRVCRPGGVVAVRDADYAAMSWYPEVPALAEWRRVYREVCHRNDAEPDAARHLLHWAAEAGFTDITPSADAWCFATPDERSWWGSLWAERVRASSLATQAIDYGLAAEADLADMAAGWNEWADHPHAWFVVPHGQLLLRPQR